VVSKTHLDVGFTDLASEVRRRYLEEFFPLAMRTAAELRARGGPERLRWTTGSWILTEALDAATPQDRRRFDAAIETGDLNWHALPFTLHTEYAERSLVEHGLSLSAELDHRYGRRTRAAKLTDVPGHTRGLVSVLAGAGVDTLHVGVNPASAAPRVPLRFRWRDHAAQRPPGAPPPELLVMYQPGGYGSVQVVPGAATAIAVLLTGDNLGPPTVEVVTAAFAELAARFPGASVTAATLDDVAEVLRSVRDDLPLLDSEIGDTWIHGVGSDPVKTSGFRSLCRERLRWLDQGLAAADDPVLGAASTRLLLVAEHTWGLDQKAHWPVEGHWDVEGLAAVRGLESTKRFESSWAEQRRYLFEFVDRLRSGGRPDLADAASARLGEAIHVEPPDLGDLEPLRPGAWSRIGDFDITVDPGDGAVVGLVDAGGRTWAGPEAPLGRWRLQTFEADDFERWFATYNSETTDADEWWARWDNTKPGLEGSGAVAASWAPVLRGAWAGRRDGRDLLVTRLGFEVEPGAPVATPADAFVTVSSPRAGALAFELCWFGLRAARWPVASWWTFAPVVSAPESWTMQKLGEQVAPGDVVPGGGSRLHAANALTHPDGVLIDLVDAPLVAPGSPRLLVWDDAPVDLSGGWHICMHANLWGTNFPMWIEGDARIRVTFDTTPGRD
jgi:hypothetical protein